MKNKIAQIVFSLPLEARFDYLIPENLISKVKIGSRVMVPFREKKMVGYVVNLKDKSKFNKLKTVISSIDNGPIIDNRIIQQLKQISEYYCCSLGEIIETSLPISVRKSKDINISKLKERSEKTTGDRFQVSVFQDLSNDKKWDLYFRKIKEAISKNKGVIFLVPAVSHISNASELLNNKFKNDVAIFHARQGRKLGVQEWVRIKQDSAHIVIGTMSAIFAPFRKIGLIIIEDEDNYVYKHDQSPHYHTRQVAFIRAKVDKAEVVLSSRTPSLETYLEVKRNKYKVTKSEESKKGRLNVQILDMKEEKFRQRKRDVVLSSFLEHTINDSLSSHEKIMLFMNRKGFSTFIHCRSCGYTLKCPRCNVGLTYYYGRKFLKCRFCNYQTKSVSICPNCQASYMRYLGLGTEKLESEMHRIFPQARIRRWDKDSSNKEEDFDILVSTQAGLEKDNFSVGTLGILSPELSLNRIDFRAAEKTFSLLYRLSKLANNKMIIQTYNPTHYSIQAVSKQNPDYFYKNELKNRKELGFPPFRHLAQIVIRGKKQDRVKEVSSSLFDRLNDLNKNKSIEIYEPNPSIPSKLRGNFYWNILLKASSVKNICSLIHKPIFEYKKKSGVITTVNVDL